MIEPSRYKQLLHSLMIFSVPTDKIEVEELTVQLSHLPPAFRGARIAVVADVHLPDSMISISRLLDTVAAQKPDAVFLPGDLSNSYTFFDSRGLRRLATGLAAIAPCFAIPGNHELRLDREPTYGKLLKDCGICYLCDSSAKWQRHGAVLTVYGMGRKRPAPLQTSQPALMLAHKPDYCSYYAAARWQLVVCGHAHGGQLRLGKQGVYSPGQGVLPSYTGGIYIKGDTTMVVSRGLGNSSIPWRFNNLPHLPVITLQ